VEMFIDGTTLGSLKVLEFYEYYDGPRFFASVTTKTRRPCASMPLPPLTQQAKQFSLGGGDNGEQSANTALVDGVRRYAMDVRELDIDLMTGSTDSAKPMRSLQRP
jgi:hypothetical protein